MQVYFWRQGLFTERCINCMLCTASLCLLPPVFNLLWIRIQIRVQILKSLTVKLNFRYRFWHAFWNKTPSELKSTRKCNLFELSSIILKQFYHLTSVTFLPFHLPLHVWQCTSTVLTLSSAAFYSHSDETKNKRTVYCLNVDLHGSKFIQCAVFSAFLPIFIHP